VYGEGQIKTGNYATVIGIFESQYSSNSSLTIVKPGTQTRCFTHIDDIIKGILLVTEKGSGDGYLLGSKEELSVIDVAKMFDRNYFLIDERKGERNFSKFENSRAETELGWKAEIKLKDYINTFKSKVKSVSYHK
jgi:UDP-glucose 4-epimerase